VTLSDAHAQSWLDLAALLDPAGMFPEPPVLESHETWLRVYQLSTAHLVSPSLHAALAARDGLARLPADVRGALEALQTLNATRNRQLRRILRDTAAVLNRVGTEPILLKGAIALLPDQYPHAFQRVMGDLDLAVGEGQVLPAFRALQAAGFTTETPEQAAIPESSDHHHAPPLFHPSINGYVELHRSVLGKRVPREVLSLPMLEADSHVVEWEGVRLRVPSLEHRLLHNALHHQVQDRAFDQDRHALRPLLEFALLRTSPEAAAIDWPGLLKHLDTYGMGDALRAQLLIVNHLFAQPLPLGVRPTPAALAAEGRFWLCMHDRSVHQLRMRKARRRYWLQRLARLPRRLVTPSWYPMKFRHLRQRWFSGRMDTGQFGHD
jgi:hypothetical protein